MNTKKLTARWILLLWIAFLAFTVPNAQADEMLSLYGLKGYAYSYSPQVVDGLHLQAGVMYSYYHESNLQCRDGYIWVAPVSLTYGDGDFWEAALGIQWEYWKNTDFDVDETGIGDLFAGGKFRFLNQEKGMPLDMSVMAYMLIPTGDRDKSIGDLYNYNPTGDDELSYGLNLLVGKQWERFYLSGTLGMNHVNTDHDYIEENTFFLSLTLEYQISETLTTYAEFINNENKNRLNYPEGHFCYDDAVDEDITEIGIGLGWVKDEWGIKIHAGAGMTETSPDFRVMAMVNRGVSF